LFPCEDEAGAKSLLQQALKGTDAMTLLTNRRISVSTWSLHRALGKPSFIGPGTAARAAGPVTAPMFSLLELPARIVGAGIHTLEICHFHLPSREPAYVQQLRDAIEDAGVELWSLLIDGGDIAHPVHHERDVAWVEQWLDVAAALGAKNARVSGGKQEPGRQAVARSKQNLQRLAVAAAARGVRLATENWQNLLSRPEIVLEVLDDLDGAVGLCADFGNWSGPQKYDDLAQIFPRAESCHAKCHFSAPGQMDRADFERCLELTRQAGFAGPYTLIYDGPGDDELAALQLERAVVLPYLDG
jgi:sugar phosphate isomerase/epimerase